jgi:ABC-type bacteriocin/lantibiotic exporter with double-glycine peptidase domain
MISDKVFINTIDVPHFIQSDDSLCGPACLKMVLAYWGFNISEKDLATACNHTYQKGCQDIDMIKAAQSYGFNAFIKNNSDISELKRYVDHKIPVIVDWFCGDLPEGHSSVVVGVDNNNVYMLDPWVEDTRIIPIDDFIRCWFDFRETPISPNNLYVRQIMIITPKFIFDL